jgi:nucleoside-diphosphate-sugar epimerase
MSYKTSKRALVCGAGGFIGGHMVKRLLSENYVVVAVDIKPLEEWYQYSNESTKFKLDLRDTENVEDLMVRGYFDEIYQFAADMGGAGYIFTGEHDADVMHNSATINLNIAKSCSKAKSIRSLNGDPKKCKIFYSSSACIYPEENQTDPENPNCEESSAYPANPDSEYGWEKLFSERLWRSYARNYGLDVCIARFHNIFGPQGTWDGGKEKAPAAMCRKAIQAGHQGAMEVWGDGQQTRSFLYIDECLEAVRRLMESEVEEVINIGSDEMIKINDLAKMAIDISGNDILIKNIPGPEGVRGRNSDNTLIKELLDWAPSQPLRTGMEKTYKWIEEQIK